MDLDTFLAHAVKLEHEAVETYERFAARATDLPEDTAAFLKEMARFARLHLEEILECAGCRHVNELPPRTYLWGDWAGPEDEGPYESAVTLKARSPVFCNSRTGGFPLGRGASSLGTSQRPITARRNSVHNLQNDSDNGHSLNLARVDKGQSLTIYGRRSDRGLAG